MATASEVPMAHGVWKRWVAVTALAAVVLIGGGVALATMNHGIVKKQFLRFRQHGYDNYDLDVGEAGRSPGDTFFVKHDLWNYDETAKVGQYDTACILEKDVGGKSLNRCTATLFLRGGSIELAGRVWFSETLPSFRLSVIGGTRKYENVVGEARVVFGDEDTPDSVYVELIPSFRHP
jgi:hypothetical protein